MLFPGGFFASLAVLLVAEQLNSRFLKASVSVTLYECPWHPYIESLPTLIYNCPPKLHSTLPQTTSYFILGPTFRPYIIIMHTTYRQSTEPCSVHTTPTISHPCDRSERSHTRSSWSEQSDLYSIFPFRPDFGWTTHKHGWSYIPDLSMPWLLWRSPLAGCVVVCCNWSAQFGDWDSADHPGVNKHRYSTCTQEVHTHHTHTE